MITAGSGRGTTGLSGAAAILAAFTSLTELGCKTAVTGYLMCTDNMPSGSALALGDVLTHRDGTTPPCRRRPQGRALFAPECADGARGEAPALNSTAPGE